MNLKEDVEFENGLLFRFGRLIFNCGMKLGLIKPAGKKLAKELERPPQKH